jgi:hypothetical protein
MYVDESGDAGLDPASPTRYFVLTGLVVHELRWQNCLEELLSFRRRIRDTYNLKLREELHAARFITRPGALVRIKRNDRLAIIRHMADQLAAMSDLTLINVVVDKATKAEGYDVFEMAWKTLIQRFENTLSRRNFAGPANPDDKGMLFPDHTDDKRLSLLLRKMRQYNPIPSQQQYGSGFRNLQIANIIEDPNFKDSEHSYFVQAADLAAYVLYQSIEPNSYMKKKGGHRYFSRLEPVLCKVASSSDPMGIVRL